MGPKPQDRGLSAVHISREVDRSLMRLGTDVIDLYVIHWPPKAISSPGTVNLATTIPMTIGQFVGLGYGPPEFDEGDL